MGLVLDVRFVTQKKTGYKSGNKVILLLLFFHFLCEIGVSLCRSGWSKTQYVD